MSNPQSTINLKEFCKRADQEKYLELGESLVKSNVGKSFSLLSFGLSLNSDKKKAYYKLYLNVVENWSNKLIELSRFQDVLKIFEVAQDIYIESPDLDYLLACTLYRIGKYREAWQYSIKSLNACKRDPKARDLVSALSSLLIDRWHFPMINDRQRNEKYKQSIQKWINEGHTSVLDIGSGSSLLSIYAKQSGCRNIYACEADEFISELGEEVLKLNSAKDQIILLNQHSKEIRIPDDVPERVSLVITETFDSGLFGERVLPTLEHAWKHLLLPQLSKEENENEKGSLKHKRVLPLHAEVSIAIIECDFVARQIKFNNKEVLNGFLVHLDLNEPYLSEKISRVPGKYKLLTEWKRALDINFNSIKEIENLLNGKINEIFSLPVITDGRGDGIIMAYNLYLDHDNYVTTFPDFDSCWENAIYPIYSSSQLTKGTEININMSCDGVLHFKLLNDSITVSTTIDAQFIKCANSSSFLNFYKTTAEIYFEDHSQVAVSVLDVCPFPQGGVILLNLNSKNKVFINKDAYNVVKESGIGMHSVTSLKGQVDVVFYWPFTSEGTLKDNILEDLRHYRKLLTKKGKIYPEYLDLQMFGIESETVAQMTSVNDSNTDGIKVAEVFNFAKTLHHLDVPIEGISYSPITPVLNPARLNNGDPKIILRGQEVDDESRKEFLYVGDSLLRSFLPFQAISKGKIIGFVYWFEMTNVGHAETEISSGSDCESKREVFEMKKLQDELSPKFGNHKDFTVFNSFSRDSPINQCILLLDEPFLVKDIQCLNLLFAMSGSHFSVDVNAQ